MVTDPISDLLIRIKNAQKVGHQTVKIPFSKLKLALVNILEREKFIGTVVVEGKKPKETILVNLKYDQGLPVIQEMKRISKPSQRIYLGSKDIKSVKSGYGMAIISTSKGLMTNKDARRNKFGGEILCEVW